MRQMIFVGCVLLVAGFCTRNMARTERLLPHGLRRRYLDGEGEHGE